MSFRKVIFWSHLIAGVVAGAVIAIMSFTGACLAFEKEIIARAERDIRRVAPPQPGAERLPFSELLARVREAQPDAGRPSGMTLSADPLVAVAMNFGRTNAVYVNPYTGEVRPQGAPQTRAFLHLMNDWHRWLGREGEGRAAGKAITGACNVAFLALAISGIYLWWPRQWTGRALRSVGLFNFKLRGRARDWNWHNVIGIWTAPVLVVLTLTAMPMSYRWAGDMIYKLTGTEAPAPGGGPGAGAPGVEFPPPPPGTRPLGYDALVAVAREKVPAWEQITLRSGGFGGRGGGSREAGAGRNEARGGERGGEGRGGERREGEGRSGAQAVTLIVKERDAWPRFSSVQLTLNPYTGGVLRQEGFGDYNLGRKVRSWTRFLHTGEALGAAGQAIAGLASLGGVVLVWTGFALAWRRFLNRRSSGARQTAEPPAAEPESVSSNAA